VDANDVDSAAEEGVGDLTGGSAGRAYDVSPDGQRFFVLKDAATPDTEPPTLIVVQHFDELLKRLVPVK
jgi:hypothetical protein